jgi:predicted dehydrogenase
MTINSTGKLRVGVLGLSHDHIWDNLKALAGCSQGVLVAAADPHPQLLQRIKHEYGCQQLFSDYEKLLDQVELDAVYIYSDNRESAQLAELAARRGLHIMLEKPMAATLAGAKAAYQAAQQAGVALMVNWPFYWWPQLQFALKLIEQGLLGQIWQVNYRAAHSGPREEGCDTLFSEWLYDPERNGAGALMDYCGYGAALSCHLLGLPSQVTAVRANLLKADLPAEDNAILIMHYSKALSTSTASWTQIGHLTSYVPTFYGSEGTLVVQPDGQVWLATRQKPDGELLNVPPPPPGYTNSAEFFLGHLVRNEPIKGLCSSELGLMVQQVLETALLSVQQAKTITLLPASS